MAFLSVYGLKVLAWTLIAVDILLTGGRLAIRWNWAGAQGIPRGIKRFSIADGLQLFALLVAITYVALQMSGIATFIQIEKYHETHPDLLDLKDRNTFIHIRFGGALIFWVAMYSVKFSFLMLYRTLFWISERFRKFWWAVLGFTMLCFWMSFFACFWVCGWPVNPVNLKQCLRNHKAVQDHIEYMWCGLNATSSILIMLLPLFMLPSLKIRLAQKISLSAIFIVACLDVFLDIFRTFYTTKSVGVQNLWEILEITIAVMLCALVAYRPLFSMFRKKTAALRAKSPVPESSSAAHYERYRLEHFTSDQSDFKDFDSASSAPV